MATVAAAPMTAAEFAAVDIDVPVELVRGEIVEMPRPGSWHGIVCANVSYLLNRWADETGSCCVLSNDSGVITERDPDTVRGPDACYIRSDRLRGGIPQGFLPVAPDLVVEVLSPNDRWQDVIAKIDEYFSAGSQEVWIVDPDLRQVQQHRTVPPPVTCRGAEMVTTPLLPGLQVSADAFFRGLPVFAPGQPPGE